MDRSTDDRWAELAQTLRVLGLWRHLSEREADEAQQRVVDTEWPFGAFGDDEPGNFSFFVDGEEMAEGHVPQVLTEMAPSLRKHGLALRVEEVTLPRADEGNYVVAINDRPCVVWTPQDWVDRRSWEAATVRPLAVINDLLAEAGAVPRLFTQYTGGNEGLAWLLDPLVVAAINTSGLQEPRETIEIASHY
jgi:hypothetical protein